MGGESVNLSVSLEQIVYLLAVAAAVVITRWQSTREVRALLRKIGYFFDDWNGTPERDGVPARAGVMLRLQGLEQRAEVTERELRTNGGSTIRDAVRRVEQTQHEQAGKLDRIAAAVSVATVVYPSVAVPVTVDPAAGSVDHSGRAGHLSGTGELVEGRS